jgi:hypothetical protein
MVKFWKFWHQHSTYLSKNMEGWKFVCEDNNYFLYLYCVQLYMGFFKVIYSEGD